MGTGRRAGLRNEMAVKGEEIEKIEGFWSMK